MYFTGTPLFHVYWKMCFFYTISGGMKRAEMRYLEGAGKEIYWEEIL